MNVLLHIANPTAGQLAIARRRLEVHAASDARILIGNPLRDDDLARRLLAESGCDSVAAYSPRGGSASERDGWEFHRVGSAGSRRSCGPSGGLGPEWEAASQMALDADCGLILWDGAETAAFAAALCLSSLGKPVDFVLPDGSDSAVRSPGDLHALLPPRNPEHRPCGASIPMGDQWAAAERFIPSKGVAERLAMAPLRKWEIAEIILGSPTPLDAKRDALGILSRYDDELHEAIDEIEEHMRENGQEDPEETLSYAGLAWGEVRRGSFAAHFEAIGEALGALKSTGPGELVYRKSLWDERPELFEQHEQGVAPFSGIEAALEDLRFEMEWDEWDDDAPFWSAFEKWRLAPDGTWENPFTYYAIKDEIVFFDMNAYAEQERYWRAADRTYGGSTAPALNLHVPFGVGEVITLDCRPFAPLRHALVIEAEREGRAECCMPRVLHLDDRESARRGEPVWTDASPKHAGGMNMCMPGYSPLYRMEPYEGPLPEEERLICEVRDWLRGDAEKGRRLSEALMCEMSSDEIREFMAGGGHE